MLDVVCIQECGWGQRLTKTVHEIPQPIRISPKRISGAVKKIPFLKNVLGQFLVCSFPGTPVASPRILRREFDENFPAFIVGLPLSKPRLGRPNNITRFRINFDGDVDVMKRLTSNPPIMPNSTNSETTPTMCKRRKYPLRACKKLSYFRDAEAFLVFHMSKKMSRTTKRTTSHKTV